MQGETQTDQPEISKAALKAYIPEPPVEPEPEDSNGSN